MAPGSAVPMCCAVRVQAHWPATKPAAINQPHCAGPSQRLSTRKAAQAHSVPTVPGALGDRPAPKPKASQRAGWRRMKAKLARMGG